MRELNHKEQEEVTGGSLGHFPVPGTGPNVYPILKDVYVGLMVQNQLRQFNVYDHIDPAEMRS